MKNTLLVVFLVGILAACAPAVTPVPTETIPPTIVVSSTPVPTSTLIPVTETPSPVPTDPIIPMITPDPIQVERWMEYQTALAESMLSSIPSETVLCEWDILGQLGQDLYVWAVCGRLGGGRWASRPVAIHLGTNGDIQNVEVVPGIGSEYISNIHKMFPASVQEKILDDQTSSTIYRRLSDHLDWRQEHPDELPLIVLSATPTP